MIRQLQIRMIQTISFRYIAVLAILALLCPVPATAIEAAIGEVVPLQGYSSGSMYVYLFLTGPNLPVNGVPLNDVTKRADAGSFTRVDVDGNDHWSYKWDTGNVNGKLDAGTYTVWVVNGPNDRSHLSQADYRTLSVTLGKPYVEVDAPQQNGAMEITSSPSGAIVKLNDQYRGRTPLTLNDLPAGTYSLSFSLDGYHDFTTPARVEAGSISEVAATLVPVTATPVPVITTASPAAPDTIPTPAATPAKRAPGMLMPVLVSGLLLLVIRHGCRR